MIDRTAIENWLAPQKRFDALRSIALAAGGSDFADVAYANPFGGTSAEVLAILRAATEPEHPLDLQYSPYGGHTVPRREAARRLRERTGIPYNYKNVFLTPGAMAAIRVLQEVFPAGNVVILSPTWIDHPLYAAAAGHEVRLVETDLYGRLDCPAIAAAIDDETRLVVLCQPGNPTGRLYDAEELAALAVTLQANGRPALLSDECHRDYLPPGRVFRSPAEFYSKTFVVYSYGKRHLIQGQRLGYLAVHPEIDQRIGDTIEDTIRSSGVCTPTAVMQRALPELESMVRGAPGCLVDEVMRRKEQMRQALSAVSVPNWGDATMFLSVGVSDSVRVSEVLAARGILVAPGTLFHSEGFVRLTASSSEAQCMQAVSELRRLTSEEGM